MPKYRLNNFCGSVFNNAIPIVHNEASACRPLLDSDDDSVLDNKTNRKEYIQQQNFYIPKKYKFHWISEQNSVVHHLPLTKKCEQSIDQFFGQSGKDFPLTQSLQPANKSKPLLQKELPKPCATVEEKNETASVKSKSESKPSLQKEMNNLCHAVNIQSLDEVKSKSTKASEPPVGWMALAELNYSPAFYNLGVWFHKQATPTQNDNSNKYFKEQAARYYLKAVKTDEHPLAAYNLATCLLDKQAHDLKIPDEGTNYLKVSKLMKIAASKGVRRAQRYLETTNSKSA